MFWDQQSPALSQLRVYDQDEAREYSYAQFKPLIDKVRHAIDANQKVMVLLFCDHSAAALATYLAALQSGAAVLLVNIQMDIALKKNLVDVYSPEFIVNTGQSVAVEFAGYLPQQHFSPYLEIYRAKTFANSPIYANTAVLLSTSGTTGSPKLVRLSYHNVQANAESIAQYLEITDKEVAITNLPFSYSYGLSIINSHCFAGAKIVCTNTPIVQKAFWQLFNDQQCTSLPGVPYNYEILERLNFEKMELPSLRTMTQAGGRLATDKIELFYRYSLDKGFRFFVMYGQTEATARISYVPYEMLGEKIGSAGIAIPGGKIDIMDGDAPLAQACQEGEVVYSGPNVMPGYAETRACLSRGDELGGVLHTGDLGHKDQDGFLYITGRTKRFLKIFGLRLNLDEVERMLEAKIGRAVACTGNDDRLIVLVESQNNEDAHFARQTVIDLYSIHHSVVKTQCTPAMPVTTSGKKDYKMIEKEMLS